MNKPLQAEDPVQLASQQILQATVDPEVKEDFMRGFENMYHKINLQNATPTMVMNSKALKQF